MHVICNPNRLTNSDLRVLTLHFAGTLTCTHKGGLSELWSLVEGGEGHGLWHSPPQCHHTHQQHAGALAQQPFESRQGVAVPLPCHLLHTHTHTHTHTNTNTHTHTHMHTHPYRADRLAIALVIT